MLWAAGTHLGSLAGRDLAARCAEGRLDAKGKAGSRAVRKRALTAESSSRWAGAIARTSEDQYRLAGQNLRAGQASLQARIRRIRPGWRSRRAGSPGGPAATPPRPSGTLRPSACGSLQARLARADRRLAAGTVSVVRGGPGAAAQAREPGRRRAGGGPVAGGVGFGPAVPDRRRGEGQGAGERDDPLAPRRRLAGGKAARPARAPGEPAHGRYRLSCPVQFSYRGTGRRPDGDGRGPLRHQPRPGTRQVVPRRVLEDLCCPRGDAGRAPGKSR